MKVAGRILRSAYLLALTDSVVKIVEHHALSLGNVRTLEVVEYAHPPEDHIAE